jgi:tetratricopeptide (TPR) repeat protein
LERKYSQALREMDAGRWSQAEGLLAEVQELEPGYQAAERLLERARREVARQQEARQLEEQVNTLYQQAIGLRRARHWRKALEKMEEIRVLSPEFKDTEGVSLQAQAEIEREEGEAQRQKQLAEKYAAAVRSLEAGQYQQALERWNEVQSLDPSYPDPQKVLKTARKKLKELSQAEAPQPRLSRQRIALYALGGVVLLGVVIFLGIRGYGGGWPEKATPPPAGLAAVATKNLTPPSTQGPTTPLPAGLSAATTNKPTTTAGLVAVATKKPNPTATRKPTTRPPTATALQMVFDDFENTQFDRAYNEAIWGNEGRNDPKIGTVTQQDGILVFTSEGKDKGMGLFLDQVWGYALDSATVLEGRLSVDKSSYGAHLGIFIEFAEGYAGCQIQAWSEDYIHCWADFFGKNYDLPVRVITPGTWHKVRIEISDLDPITFDYYADDKHLGQIIPERAGMISKRLTGVQFHLISYAEKLNYGYVDDVYFGPPR